MFPIIPEGYSVVRGSGIATHKMIVCVHCAGKPATEVYPVDASAADTLLPDVQAHNADQHPEAKPRGAVLYLRSDDATSEV